MNLIKHGAGFFLTGALLACAPQPNALGSMSTSSPSSPGLAQFDPNAVYYIAEFKYNLYKCQGNRADILEGLSQGDYFQITKIRDRVKFLRPAFVKKMNIGVHSIWAAGSQRLYNSHGQFGIADQENWRKAVGTLSISQSEISGQIDQIEIMEDDTLCQMSLEFKGASVLQCDENSPDCY